MGYARADSALAGSDDDVGEEVLLWQVISGGAALTPIIAHTHLLACCVFGNICVRDIGNPSGRTGLWEDGRGSRNRYLMLAHAAVQATASSDSS